MDTISKLKQIINKQDFHNGNLSDDGYVQAVGLLAIAEAIQNLQSLLVVKLKKGGLELGKY